MKQITIFPTDNEDVVEVVIMDQARYREKKIFLAPFFALTELIRLNLKTFVLLFVLSMSLTSCFSLLKADRMVYAGSIGKKIDAVLVDSISKVDVNKAE